MATISGANQEKVFSIKKWGGLNENPDGDTKLKLGEASAMRNWRVTRDGNLQRRPGLSTKVNTETNKPILGLWVGFVNGTEVMLGACNGKLYKLWDRGNGFGKTELGSVSTANSVHIFGFSDIAYILDGTSYLQWDGTTLKAVDGYRPLVKIAIPPDGADDDSSTLEEINRLNGNRRVWLSPDGTHDTFTLPEIPASVDWVKDLSDDSTLTPTTDYTVNLTTGQVTFIGTPAESVNSYEVGYTVSVTYRTQVEAMRYSELFAGTQDTRVFLYGDGTNHCIYSGLDYDGTPRADYFPDLYDCHVGDSNTPITGMIRHYSQLVCFKSSSSWIISASEQTLADGATTPAFYVTPVNRAIGNAALGQVRLVLNAPYTLFGNDLYLWKNNSSYSSNLTQDERQAQRISDRVWSTLKSFDASNCICYDDNAAQEYYICYNGEALVYNYAADAWTKYTRFDVSSVANIDGELYVGSPDGKLKLFSYKNLSDDGETIDAYWESGSMDFGQDYMRKYSAMLWLGLKPEGSSEVTVTVRTDRSSAEKEKVVSAAYKNATAFSTADFRTWCFGTSERARMEKLKIKAKKFVYYNLVLTNNKAGTRATVLAADIRVRFTGYTK